MRGRTFYNWICRSKKEPGMTCSSRNYRESFLEEITARILGMDSFDAEAFEAQVKTMVVQPDGSIEYRLVGNETRVWKDLHISDSRHIRTLTDAFQGRIICGKCGRPYHRVNAGGKWVYWYCIGKKRKGEICNSPNFTDYALRQISAHMMGTDMFDEALFTRQVTEIRVLSEDSLEYHFSDGRMETWERM